MGERLENAEGGTEMNCMKCGREAYISTTTEVFELGFGILVVRNISCYKCEECDEIFYTGDVVKKLEQITEKVKSLMQEITVIDYGKAVA